MPLFFARILLEKEILGRGINSGDKVILNRSGAGPSNFFFFKKAPIEAKRLFHFQKNFPPLINKLLQFFLWGIMRGISSVYA